MVHPCSKWVKMNLFCILVAWLTIRLDWALLVTEAMRAIVMVQIMLGWFVSSPLPGRNDRQAVHVLQKGPSFVLLVAI